MKTVWKYSFNGTSAQRFWMPSGATVLSLQVARGFTCMWALVNSEAPLVVREFRVYGTGHQISEDSLTFVGTFQVNEVLVFHVFEVTPC